MPRTRRLSRGPQAKNK